MDAEQIEFLCGLVEYDVLPEHMRDGAKRYIEHGTKPGDFMRVALCNDLVGAAERADSINLHCLVDWAAWLHWNCPSGAWGSPEKVNAWIAKGGLRHGWEGQDE
jgi:hypothetical protein